MLRNFILAATKLAMDSVCPIGMKISTTRTWATAWTTHKTRTSPANPMLPISCTWPSYGGRDVSTNEEFTAEQIIRMLHHNNQASGLTEGNKSNDKKKGGGLNLGAEGSNRSLRNERSLSIIPLSEGRVIPVDVHNGQAPERRILHADEHSEIHVLDNVDYPGHTVVQHYLLVKPDQ